MANALEHLRALLRHQVADQIVPSLAVSVAQRGTVLWEEGFGWADRENRVPATPDTMYSLASITKPMTATGLMLLHERGRLDLDRPIDDYLGGARLTAHVGDAAGATIRRVANHTAGLPPHHQFFYEDEPYRPPPMAETIRRYGILVTAPGERILYSNLGYGLLGHAIARLSGKGYAAFMREEVFLPLGMAHTSVGIGPGLESFQAVRYGGDGVRYPFYDFDHPGGSAAFGSVHDLVRFGQFHLKAHLADQEAIVSDAAIDAMQVGTRRSHDDIDRGIGWRIREDDLGYRTVGHSGHMGGVSTELLLVPSDQLVVAVLANALGDLPQQITEEILAALLPAYRDRRAGRLATKAMETAAAATPESTFTPPADLLGAWQGDMHTYEGRVRLTLWIGESGGIQAQLGTQPRTLLTDCRFEQGYLTGQMPGSMTTGDARRRPHRLHVDLRRRDRILTGAITALSWNDSGEGGAPDKRYGNALSYWAALARQPVP